MGHDEQGEYGPRGNGNTIRQELWRMEDRLLEGQADLKQALTEFIRGHSQVHLNHDRWSAEQLALIQGQFQARALDAARRDGAWGVVRVMATALSRNWTTILAVLAALLALTNTIRITFQ